MMKSNRDQVFNSSSYVMGTEMCQQQHQNLSVGAFSVVYFVFVYPAFAPEKQKKSSLQKSELFF